MLLRLGLAMQLTLMFMPLHLGFAQLSAVSRLPKETGAVVWTSNFPAFEQRLRDQDLHPFIELRTTFDLIQDRVGSGELTLSDWQNEKLKVWTKANDSVLAALDNRVFPGEFSLSISQTSEQNACVTLIAQTDANKEELQLLVDALSLLISIENPDWYAPVPKASLDDRERANHENALRKEIESAETSPLENGPTWELQDGWFVWSSSDRQREQILESITSDLAEHQLKSIREFQTLVLKFNHIHDNEGAIRFYLSPEWMGSVASRIEYEQIPYPFNTVFYPLDWLKQSSQAAGMDQVRSLGGKIMLGQESRLKSTTTLFAADAFLLTTAPAKGLLKPIQRQEGFHFAPPLPPGDLGVFGQIQVQGDELVQAVSESIREAFSAAASEGSTATQDAIDIWRQRNGFMFTWPERLGNQLDSVAFVALNPKVCSPRNYLHPYQMLHFRDSGSLEDDVHDFLLSRVPGIAGPSVSSLDLVDSSESMEWRIPQESIESYVQNDYAQLLKAFYDKELAIRKQKYAETKSPAEADRLINEFQQELEITFKSSLESTRNRLSKLAFRVEDGWVPLNPFDSDKERDGSSVIKLQRLRQIVEDAKNTLDFTSEPAILFSFWAYEHLYNTSRDWPTDEDLDSELSLSKLRSKPLPESDAAPSLRNLGRSQFIQRFDSLVILSSRERNGFDIRIVAVAAGEEE